MEDAILNVVPEETIMAKIFLVRGVKVMIDRDIALLYGVPTKVLNQAVNRNIKRFPEDFMFQMTSKEFGNWKSQIVTSKADKMGLRKRPLAFTELGVAMLSGIINSDTAISVSIQIIRVFVKLRELLKQHAEILQKIEEIQKKDLEQDSAILLIFDYLKQLEQSNIEKSNNQKRRMIGFKIDKLK
jgi:hypothetical protein